MTIWHAILLAIIEGITEFLPISSTGHLTLATQLMGLEQTNFLKSFEIYIQLGAIGAVLVLYFKRLLSQRDLWLKIAIAFLPSAIVGLTLYKFIKQYILGNSYIVLISLFVGGIILVLFDRYFKKYENERPLKIKHALIVGLAQIVSIIPGVSRSASTIIGGSLAGLTRKQAVEFSFFLAIPTMVAAAGLDLVDSSFNFSSYEITLVMIGMVGSFITALCSIRFFLAYIQKHSFTVFGVYRIILAVILYLYWSLTGIL